MFRFEGEKKQPQERTYTPSRFVYRVSHATYTFTSNESHSYFVMLTRNGTTNWMKTLIKRNQNSTRRSKHQHTNSLTLSWCVRYVVYFVLLTYANVYTSTHNTQETVPFVNETWTIFAPKTLNFTKWILFKAQTKHCEYSKTITFQRKCLTQASYRRNFSQQWSTISGNV